MINELFKKIEAQDKIINTQALEIAKLKEDKKKAIEYIKENSYIAQDKEINGIPLMSKRLDKCDDLLEILGDKENEWTFIWNKVLLSRSKV